MSGIELIGVPLDGWGRAGHQARAAAALREHGLLDALAGRTVRDAGDVPLPVPDPGRAPESGIRNEPGVLALTDELRPRVGAAVRGGRP